MLNIERTLIDKPVPRSRTSLLAIQQGPQYSI